MLKAYNLTAQKILDAAEFLTQTRGFNDFSYMDLQQEVGVKTSTIHYYFKSKQDLATAMATRYVARFLMKLEQADQEHVGAFEKLQAMAQIFVDVSQAGKLCLCGMMTADLLSIPEEGLDQLVQFFDKTESWCAKVIQQGIEEGVFRAALQPENAAAHFLAALEGGGLIVRTRKDAEYMQVIVTEALSALKA